MTYTIRGINIDTLEADDLRRALRWLIDEKRAADKFEEDDRSLQALLRESADKHAALKAARAAVLQARGETLDNAAFTARVNEVIRRARGRDGRMGEP